MWEILAGGLIAIASNLITRWLDLRAERDRWAHEIRQIHAVDGRNACEEFMALSLEAQIGLLSPQPDMNQISSWVRQAAIAASRIHFVCGAAVRKRVEAVVEAYTGNRVLHGGPGPTREEHEAFVQAIHEFREAVREELGVARD